MTPAPSREHQGILGALFYELYWIVHPIDRIVMVFLLKENGEYGKPRIYAGKDRVLVNLFPDLIIDLKNIFAE
jgi:Uma2 family endonuclease